MKATLKVVSSFGCSVLTEGYSTISNWPDGSSLVIDKAGSASGAVSSKGSKPIFLIVNVVGLLVVLTFCEPKE
nr:hypothetical protein [Rufibacter sediminis]